MLRIIAGKYRGYKLQRPPESISRPTMDRVRQSVFNMLDSYFMSSGIDWSTRHVLDAFAGSGAYGLEAYSRGANRLMFIESNKTAQDILSHNIKHIGIRPENFLVSQNDFLKTQNNVQMFNLIFLDPPFGKGYIEKSLQHLKSYGWLERESIIICELPTQESVVIPMGYRIVQEKVYGLVQILFLIFESS